MTTRLPKAERPVEAEGPEPPESLFEEARRRRRRRYALGVLAVVGAAGLVAGLVGSSSPPPPSGPPAHRSTPPSSSGYSVSTSDGATARSVGLPGFSPSDIVSLDHELWLVGRPSSTSAGTTQATRCSVEEVDPATMRRVHRFPLEACGAYVVRGGRDIFLTVITNLSPTNPQSVRLERFDPATGRSVVLPPVDVTVSGSSRAHCELAYADGAVWFWGYGTPGTPGDGLVEISPSTGAVMRTLPSSVLPGDGLPRNVLVGSGQNLWLAGAPTGGREVIEVLGPGRTTPRVVYSGGEFIQWMSAVGGEVWAYGYTVHTTPSNPANETTTHPRLVEIGATGAVKVVPTSSTLAGDGIVGSGSSRVGSGWSCRGPLRVWKIDGRTAKVTPLVAVHTPYETCLGTSGLAVADHAAFTFLADEGFASRLVRIGFARSGDAHR